MTFPTAPQKAFSFSSGLMGWKHDVIGAHPWNKLRVIQRIDEFNFTEGEEKLGFQLSGCRGGQRSISHVWRRQWREIEQCKKNCLHLSDKKRVDMFRTLARHIMTKILNPDRLKVFKNVRAELAEINVNV